jgi:hypothetical protein
VLALAGATGGVVSAVAEPPDNSAAPTPALETVRPDRAVAAVEAEPAGVAPTQPVAEDPPSQLASVRSDTPAADSRCDPTTVVRISNAISIRSEPGGKGQRLATMPASSKYLSGTMWVPVHDTSADGRYFLVDVPWSVPARRGWIEDGGFERRTTEYRVRVSIANRSLELLQGCSRIYRATVAIGGASTPTPTGTSFVTDLTIVPRDQPQFGSFAFGLSATQPNLPAGWTGGDQMALHGTNRPSSIGQAASTGCVRLTEESLTVLRKYVGLGTPVEIR